MDETAEDSVVIGCHFSGVWGAALKAQHSNEAPDKGPTFIEFDVQMTSI
jgi:hypothetical protein